MKAPYAGSLGAFDFPAVTLPERFATERRTATCPTCAFVLSARTPAALLDGWLEHEAYAHPEAFVK